MQIGYGLFNNNNIKKAIIVWDNSFEQIKIYFENNNIKTLKQFDEIFNGNENVENWAQDYEMALANAIISEKSKNNETYAKLRLDLLKFFIDKTMPEDLNYLNSIRALAETYYSLRDVKKGEETYLKLIKENPTFVWGYVGYSDEYWLNNEDDKNYAKAKDILSQALLIENLEDKDVVNERLEDLTRLIKENN